MTDTASERLAARCGIVPAFEDARGETRVTATETRIALLAAMGVAAADEAQAAASLARLDAEEAGRPLPPVAVVTPRAAVVRLNLPAGADSVAWRLVLEDGSERRGHVHVAALPVAAPPQSTPHAPERRWDLGASVDPLPYGYHRLSLDAYDATMALIVSPGQCWLPPALAADQRRLWGVSAQLYLLRSAKNWGIGDFGDLKALTRLLHEHGADVVGLNPLHALFVDEPEEASPYAPASRLLLNVLNIDVAAVPEFATCAPAQRWVESADFRAALSACRSADRVDYATVARLKLETLELLFAEFDAVRIGSRREAFERFRRDGGTALERGSLFFALREHFAQDPAARGADWHAWPDEFRDPDSPAVRQFADAHAGRLTFYAWLQFLADSQLAEAAQAASPMAVGLYRDLAVGAHAAGAETWANQAAVAPGVRVGAPPDIHNPAGQNWGLPPFNPRALQAEGYRSFVELLRANMRHAGGLRIDHVMGLQQLYWVPDGKDPAAGAYVRYPIEDMLGILALESRRQRCLVVGEDLGTVPAGFRERLAAAAVLSYRVLFFEQVGQEYIPADEYPALAVAVAGSHDLPTVLGWWRGVDVDTKERLNLYPTADGASQARAARQQDKQRLLAALQASGSPEHRQGGGESVDSALDDESLLTAVHAFLAVSRAALAMVQIDDVCAEIDQVNVPATSREHPNWRRRQSVSLEQLARHPRLEVLARLFRAARRSAVAP